MSGSKYMKNAAQLLALAVRFVSNLTLSATFYVRALFNSSRCANSLTYHGVRPDYLS